MSAIFTRIFAIFLGLALVLPADAGAALFIPQRPAVTSDVGYAAYVCDRYGCYYTRRPPRYRPPSYRPPPPPPPIYRPPPVYRPMPSQWSRHVRWCLNRYRSYNPETDRYLGYDG